MTGKTFSSKLIEWYLQNKRTLPWRETTDAYKIWLSEIILQQTRVAQGLPYYERFVSTYPTVKQLAAAPLQNVLRLWQGLGYYSRARNLHACAKYIAEVNKGIFPSTFLELQKLPGVGPYTAAAIASIAFKESVAVVDGNVYRLLARVFGSEKDIASSEGKKYFFEKANELVPQNHPDLFNQAMMEFGALHCLPQNPKCEECIFSKSCVAKQHHMQMVLPIKSKPTKIRKRYFYYFVLRYKNKILMKQRTHKDIWHGLHDFYLVETSRNQKPDSILAKDKFLHTYKPTSVSKQITHVLSHQQLKTRFIEIEVASNKDFFKLAGLLDLECQTMNRIKKIPKPILIARYLNQ